MCIRCHRQYDGGLFKPGHTVSTEVREKLGRSWRGKTQPLEMVERRAAAHRGMKYRKRKS
jgi:hypothetical protein